MTESLKSLSPLFNTKGHKLHKFSQAQKWWHSLLRCVSSIIVEIFSFAARLCITLEESTCLVSLVLFSSILIPRSSHLIIALFSYFMFPGIFANCLSFNILHFSLFIDWHYELPSKVVYPSFPFNVYHISCAKMCL